MPAAMEIQSFINSLQEEYIPRARAAAKRAIFLFANKIMADAKELCPKQTGFLANSGEVMEAVDVDALITCEIGFNCNYAAAVHEILTNHHPNGQAKFLETAMRANLPQLVEFIKAEINKEFA